MSDVKWIKIVVDIFDDEKIQLIEALPSADTVIVIWFKILCLAGKSNNGGILLMNDRIPYTDEMLAAIFRRKVTDVRMALEIFEKYEMIEIIEDTYVIPNWSKHQSLDYYEKKKEHDREYHRIKRAQQKAMLEDKNKLPEEEKQDCEEKCRTTVERQSSDLSNSLSNNYIFKDHSNIDNLKYLMDNQLYKDSKYIEEHPALYDSIKDWMGFRDEQTPKKKYLFTERGMKGFLSEIIRYHKDYGDVAIAETVTHTISGQWQGIVYDWMERKYKKLDKQPGAPKLQINMDRPERFRPLSESTWVKLEPYVSGEGLDWAVFDEVEFTEAEKKELRENGIGNWTV